MNTNKKQGLAYTFLFAICLLFSASAGAHGGWGGGHGWHGGGWHGGGWHGGNWYRGGWGGYGWGGYGWGGLGGILLGAPLYYNSYGCQPVQVCSGGACWIQQSCY